MFNQLIKVRILQPLIIYGNMQYDYVDKQQKYVDIQDDYVHMWLQLCCMSTYLCCMLTYLIYLACRGQKYANILQN